jgi:hypothetical protein
MATKHYGSLRNGKHAFEADSSEEDLELPTIRINSSGPVTAEQLAPARVIPPETPWRQHPRWKPLMSTPTHSLSSTYLVPDRSRTPSHRGSFTESENPLQESPTDSIRYQRRRKERVDRPLIQGTLRSIGTNRPRELTPRLGLKSSDDDVMFEGEQKNRGLLVPKSIQKTTLSDSKICPEGREVCTCSKLLSVLNLWNMMIAKKRRCATAD